MHALAVRLPLTTKNVCTLLRMQVSGFTEGQVFYEQELMSMKTVILVAKPSYHLGFTP
jgi:hypothetical protein